MHGCDCALKLIGLVIDICLKYTHYQEKMCQKASILLTTRCVHMDVCLCVRSGCVLGLELSGCQVLQLVKYCCVCVCVCVRVFVYVCESHMRTQS